MYKFSSEEKTSFHVKMKTGFPVKKNYFFKHHAPSSIDFLATSFSFQLDGPSSIVTHFDMTTIMIPSSSLFDFIFYLLPSHYFSNPFSLLCRCLEILYIKNKFYLLRCFDSNLSIFKRKNCLSKKGSFFVQLRKLSKEQQSRSDASLRIHLRSIRRHT